MIPAGRKPCPYCSTLANGMRLYGPRHACFTVYGEPERDRAAEVAAAEDRAEQAAFDAAREREYDPAEDNYGRTPQSPHDAWKGGRP